jgi:ferric-dicitrate binding protein FerR (iron transport regulator)
MSTSVPPRDGGAFSGPPTSVPPLLGDELALKRVFDRDFGACLATARTQLGDAESQAPRIVQTAFVNAWNQRASFSSEDQLKSFLTEQISFGASRALSRRAAAHRFGTHGGRDDVQTTGSHSTSAAADATLSWNEISRALHGEVTSKDAHAAVATAGRHEAAEHMKSVAKKGQWKVPVTIGVLALATMAAGFFYLDKLGEGEAALQAVSSAAIQPIASQSGQIGSTTLADGSKVKMGPETKLFIPDEFPAKIRAVKVEGTVQFDVAKQPLPFYAVVRKSQVIATGTSFVVSTFAPDSAFAVLVREGTVTVKTAKGEKALTANQTALVKGGVIGELPDAEKAELFDWVDGKVSVTNQPLRNVMEQLVRWFNLDIKIPDASILDRPASFAVSLDSSRAAIAQVEKSANVKFAYEGDTKVFRDAGAKTVEKKKK